LITAESHAITSREMMENNRSSTEDSSNLQSTIGIVIDIDDDENEDEEDISLFLRRKIDVDSGSLLVFNEVLLFWSSFVVICVIIFGFVSTAHVYGTSPTGISLFLLLIIVFAVSTSIAYKGLIKRIPRFCCGKRRFTKSHEHSLVSILRALYMFIPDEETLTRIDEKARENVIIAQKVMERELRVGEMELFMAGSTSERFNLPVTPCWCQTNGVSEISHPIVSDFDYMISPTAVKASFTSEQGYLVITDNPKLQPGFVQLHDNESGNLIGARTLKGALLGVTKALKVEDFRDFQPDAICYCFRRLTIANAKVKGPAIELSIGTTVNLADRFYCDLTFSVKCLQWPETVSDWTSRPGKKWPLPHEVVRIASLGCHIVPKSQPNDKEELSWRISFSRAEVELSKLIPPTARMCLVGLKIIAKDYLSVACSRISSYQLKSLLFYAMEKTDPQFWLNEENLEQCFFHLFENLLESVTNKYCPHFWIPQVNLFADLEKRDIKKLTKVLRKILKSPQHYIEEFKPFIVPPCTCRMPDCSLCFHYLTLVDIVTPAFLSRLVRQLLD